MRNNKIYQVFCWTVFILLVACGDGQASDSESLARRVGIASIMERGCYLAIDNDDLAKGIKITLVDTDQPGPAFKLPVKSRVERPKWPDQPLVDLPQDRFAPIYELECSPTIDRSINFLGLGVVEFGGNVSNQPGGIRADFDGTGVKRFAYSCTSSETIHFVIRKNEKGPLLWRAGFYLGYDVERTCTDADLR